MLKMFIGSSTAAQKRGLLDGLAEGLAVEFPDVEIRPWTKIFTTGRFTLATLLDEAELCDFAVLLFAKGDQAVIAKIPEPVTRDSRPVSARQALVWRF
jgi:hypothetical protein